jgi:deoxynucleoside triphosphate triphosphohydrolase SAMHD1
MNDSACNKRPPEAVTPNTPPQSATVLPARKVQKTLAFGTPDDDSEGICRHASPTPFKLRNIKWDYVDTRRTNDDIHSSIPLNPIVKCFMDTRPFQRLRDVKQLGTAEKVYMNCTHSRFEHSVGVAHLAGTLCYRIQQSQPSLQCTAKDVICVQLAGLLHDIGHGPFSHFYEHFVKVDLPKYLEQHPERKTLYKTYPVPGKSWTHEVASLMMMDAALEELGLQMDIDRLDEPLVQIGDGVDALSMRVHDSGDDKDYPVLTGRDMLFVKECIWGKPVPWYTSRLGPGFHGRPNEYQDWLYDIVANRHSGLDVDKIDYFARDQRRALKEAGEINKVIMEEAVVAWAPCTDSDSCHRCNGRHRSNRTPDPSNGAANASSLASSKPNHHLMICYPKKLIPECMDFFRMRFALYSKIYMHKTHEGVAAMLSDILCMAVRTFLGVPLYERSRYPTS